MDQRFKSMVDIDNQVAGKKAAIPLQFAPIEGFVQAAAAEGVHSTSNAYYIHQASVSPVEGIPIVSSFLTPLDTGLQSRQQEFYIQQPNPSAEGLIVLNSRPMRPEGLFLQGHSNRDDDRASNMSEEASCARVKLLCSYGGKILPRPSDCRLRYVGGETRMVTVSRDITFSSVMVKMVEIQPQTVSIKYQLPDEDLDALVSVSSEEDLENMMEEYDKLEAGDHPRLRVFLFTAADYDAPAVPDAFGDAKNTEQQYLDAINGLSEAPVKKLSDVSTQSAASSMSGQPGVAASQAASFQEQVQQLQQVTQQAPVMATQQLVPETVQIPQVAGAEQDGPSPVVWSSEAQGSTVYTAVGVPFQSVDASRLYPNTAYHQTLSAVNVRADGTLIGGQHVLVANQNGTGYSLYTNTTGPLVPDLVQTEPISSYEYQALGEKLSLQKPKEMQESVLLTSEGQLNGSVVTTVSQSGQTLLYPASDFDVSTARLQESVAADPRAHISELSAWSTGTPAGDGSTLTSQSQLCSGVEVEPASSFQLPDSLVNFLEDSLHVASTSVDSCTTEMPQSEISSNNMPFDLLTSDDFGRASCNSTGSTFPSSAASSSSYTLDNAAALAESPSKFLDNLNTGLLFPVDDAGDAEKPAPHPALRTPTSSAKDDLSSFIFPAKDLERKEVTDHKVGERSSQDERPQERLDAPLNTTEQKLTEPVATPHDDVQFKSTLPDVPDFFQDPDESTANPAETEAMARARGLQVIRHSALEEIRELGSGTFGTVYHGKWRGTDVAIKRIKASCFFGSSSEQGRLKDDFWSEASNLAKMHHPNVVAFYGVVPDSPGGTLATVTEFMVNGSLKQVLQRKDSNKVLDRRRRLLIAMDAAFGMEYLHDQRVIHFDLKGENLLVNMRDPHRPVCKVGDLGLSKIKHKTMVSGGVRGTLPWMAPELLNGKSILVSEKVDVFSFGIVMWELLTGEEPYADLHYGAIIGGIVSNGLRPPIPSYCEPEWKSLMERCWADDPAARPTFTEIANELRGMMSALVKQQHQQAQASQAQQAQASQAQQSQGQQQQSQGQQQQQQQSQGQQQRQQQRQQRQSSR